MKGQLAIIVSTGLALGAAGCATYVDAQSQLLHQARRGVGQLEASLEQKSQIIRRHHAVQRLRLDEACDDDARNRPPDRLTADWVIEHRRAYAAALDAMAAARFASLQADEADARNAQAVHAALERIEWLHAIQRRISSFAKEHPHDQD
jgi:hypothetical protein